MTFSSYDDSDRVAEVIRIYRDLPLADGDAVLVLDDNVCLELEGFANEWDSVLRRNTAEIVRRNAHEVLVLIAREDEQLLDRDYQLWRDLHADLAHSDVDLRPVRALPAA